MEISEYVTEYITNNNTVFNTSFKSIHKHFERKTKTKILQETLIKKLKGELRKYDLDKVFNQHFLQIKLKKSEDSPIRQHGTEKVLESTSIELPCETIKSIELSCETIKSIELPCETKKSNKRTNDALDFVCQQENKKSKNNFHQ